MGKHETAYARVERDFYPTPTWPTAALCEFVDVSGKLIWEPACGTGEMAEALVAAGASVFATDIEDRGYPRFSHRHDFLGPLCNRGVDGIITNPPFGPRGKLAEAFIESGLRAMGAEFLALLLPCDLDSAKSRIRFFGGCSQFAGKIVLTQRVVWFERSDGVRAAPKENSAWFVWGNIRLSVKDAPVIRYAPDTGAGQGVSRDHRLFSRKDVSCSSVGADRSAS